jgi:putative peptidoglycan lipid II flippase
MSSSRSTWTVSAAVMASRVLGLAREMMFAAIFGHGVLMDCYNLAFRIPNLLRDLFAEGALSQAFVTTFSKKTKESGPESAWPLATKTLTLAAVLTGAISILGIIFSPQFVHLLTSLDAASAATGEKARTFSPQDIELTIRMTRIMWPFILLVSLAALVMGMLNSRNIFGVPALSSCFFNLGSMIAGAGIGWWIDPHWGPQSMIGFSVGVLVGGLGQLLFQVPSLHRLGFRWRLDWNWRDPGVRMIGRLMLPAVISASVVQVNVVVNSIYAASISQGAVSALNWAFRLMQLPIGIFGVAVATVTLPALSRAAMGSISPDFRPILAKGIRLTAFLVVPCSIGLALLAEPIICVIYERGAFNAAGRIETALALRCYAFGLVAYSWLKVLQPAFYAMGKRWIPMYVSFFSIGLNAAANYYFVVVLHHGVESLAITTSIVAGTNFLLLYLSMRKFAGGLETGALARTLGQSLLAGAAMAVVCIVANRTVFRDLTHLGQVMRLVWVLVVVGASAAVYLGAAKLLRVPEAEEAITMVLRKLRR